MHSYGTSLLFWCRLCKSSFQIVDDFIEHKKEEHFVEFRTSNCIVFEDILILNTSNDEDKTGMLSTVGKEKGNPVSSLNAPLVGIETNLTEFDLSHSPKHIPHDQADTFDPFPTSTSDYQNDDNHENLSCQDDDEISDSSLQPNHDDYEAFDSPRASANVSFNYIEPKKELTELENDQKINSTPSDALTQGPQNPYVLLKKLSSKEIQKYSCLQNEDTVQAEVTSKSRCKLCLKKFNSKAELEIHCRVCIFDNNTQHRYCSPCQKLFNSKSAQNLHKIRVHGTEDEKRKLYKFKCKVCLKVYMTKNSLTYHMESHKDKNSQIRPFNCDTCSLSFLAKNQLRRHQAIHSLARPYKCTELGCDKAFKREDTLQKHIKYLHSNILELFKCPERNCASTFRRKQALRRHLRRSHTTKGTP